VASEAELDNSTGGELLLGGMNTELQNAGGASSEEYENIEVLAQWAIRKETKLATVRQGTGHHHQRISNGKPSRHETQRGHIDLQIMLIKTTANSSNWMLPGNDQDLTSREKNSKGEFESNYVSNAHNQDT